MIQFKETAEQANQTWLDAAAAINYDAASMDKTVNIYGALNLQQYVFAGKYHESSQGFITHHRGESVADAYEHMVMFVLLMAAINGEI